MNDNESQRLLGELNGKFDHFTEEYKNDRAKIREELKLVQTDLTKLQTELSLYKTVVKFFRAIVLTIFSVLAFKFGDISTYWDGFFDGK